jgi:hybrid cluster-associated redox disulfide protein
VKITEQMTIAEVLKAAPQTRKVFERYNMGCRGCQGSITESVARGARNHGLDPQSLLKELNASVKAAE